MIKTCKAYEYSGDTEIYDQREVDAELARLRAEAKSHFDQALANGAEVGRLRERVAELESDLAHYFENTGLVPVHQRDEAIGRSNLLLEAVRWCVKFGVAIDNYGIYGHVGISVLDDLKPPESLKDIFAPLIAEALEIKT